MSSKFVPWVAILLWVSTAVFAQSREFFSASEISDIKATVLSIRRMEFPRAKLELRVNSSSNHKVLNPSYGARIITAENYLWKSGGQIDYKDSRNIDSLAAYYLLPGDEIRAKLMSGVTQGCEWLIYGISRSMEYIPAPIPNPTPSTPPKSTSMHGNIMLTLEADKETYQKGQPVTLTFTITNVGTAPVTYNFSSSQMYDFVITQGGREVWRWSKGKAFTQAFVSLTLQAGESKSFRETWRQTGSQGTQLTAGEYSVTAVLTLADRNARPSAGPIKITIQ